MSGVSDETVRGETENNAMEKSPDAFRTISEVAEDLDLPQHVLRFWETKFSQIKPLKRGGGRRYYRPDDVALITGLKALLYGQGYTIKGVQRILKEQGARYVQAVGRGQIEPGPEPGAQAPAKPAAVTAQQREEPQFHESHVQELSVRSQRVETVVAPAQPVSTVRQMPASVTAPDIASSLKAALADLQNARNGLMRVLRPAIEA